jgi:hypothetical protein
LVDQIEKNVVQYRTARKKELSAEIMTRRVLMLSANIIYFQSLITLQSSVNSILKSEGPKTGPFETSKKLKCKETLFKIYKKDYR